MKKIIKINITISLLLASLTFSFAQNIEEGKEASVISKILNIFKSKEPSKISTENVATNTTVSTSNSSEIIIFSEEKKEVLKEEKTESVKNVKKELVKDTLCENKIKVNIKKDKINKQIKNQIVDKNKLVDTLINISASSTEENKSALDEKILKLESEVAEIIKTQKDLVNILNSTSTYICVPNTKNTNKIKDLEKNIDIKAEIINKIIKEEIKDVLKNVE